MGKPSAIAYLVVAGALFAGALGARYLFGSSRRPHRPAIVERKKDEIRLPYIVHRPPGYAAVGDLDNDGIIDSARAIDTMTGTASVVQVYARRSNGIEQLVTSFPKPPEEVLDDVRIEGSQPGYGDIVVITETAAGKRNTYILKNNRLEFSCDRCEENLKK